MKSFTRLLLTIIILMSAGYHTYAQDYPAWILLEKGKVAYDSRDILQASELIISAVEAVDVFPEAEYWLGKIYATQGQNELAEEQFRRALEQAIYLRVADDRYIIIYDLINTLMNQGASRRNEVENLLVEITISDGAVNREQIELEHLYIDTLTNKGLDELLYLYRNPLKQSLKAYRMLGQMAWEDGRYRSSFLYSLRSVLALLSTVAEKYLEYDGQWRFDIDSIEDAKFPDRDVRFPDATDGVADLLKNCRQFNPAIYQWLQESGFWPQFYLLSVSLYAEGFTGTAQSLWSFMTRTDAITGRIIPLEDAGRWGILAVEQLKSPFITTGLLEP